MISFGAILVDELPYKIFYGNLKPISDNFIPEALAVSGHSSEKTLNFAEPNWIKETWKDRPIFIGDNNGFDLMFVCWYFHHFIGTNPFGFSYQNSGSCTKELKKTHPKILNT